MKISIIIPIYNVENFIERCLTSIINQTYTKEVECIIVNDCTPDTSMEIIQYIIDNYNGPINFKILHHLHNRGLSAVRNTGLNAASGDYIIHIDSDDYCELNMLEEMYNTAIKENADIVVADYWKTFENSETYHSQHIPLTKAERVKDVLNCKLMGYNWNKLIKKSLYIDNKLEYIEGVNFGEDFLIAIQLFYYANKVVHIPKAFLHYVQYNTNSYSGTISKKSLEELIKGEVIVTDFLRKTNLLIFLKTDLLKLRIRNWHMLLLRSKGTLQKEWNQLYKDITPQLVLKHSSLIRGKYWRLSIFFASLGMLPIYNLMREIWRTIRRKHRKRIVLYNA